ncbi:unnamed protein product [Gordionus sp. m RMFG-2023]
MNKNDTESNSETSLNKRLLNKNNSSDTIKNNFSIITTNSTSDNNLKKYFGEKDSGNVCLLLFLYVLQGIPLGLAGAVPLILQQYGHVTYKEQAFFIDATYWRHMGWRKSWLIPVQYCIGGLMLLLSLNVENLVFNAASSWSSLFILTSVFFLLNVLAATQDIAVDGWALTMLSRKNVGLASTCNSIGQTAGYFLGNIFFLALESSDFCNKYLRSVPSSKGLMTFSDFLQFWGLFFIISTTLVWILKKEKPHFPRQTSQNVVNNIKNLYYTLWDIIKLPHIKSYIIICLTMKIGFSAADSVTGLKLMDAGVSKEKLAFLAVPLIPLQILFPLIINKYSNTDKPINLILKAFPYRLLIGGIFALLVWWTTQIAQYHNPPQFSTFYYFVLFLAYALHQVASYSMYVAIMAFHAKISDPRVGGTYMTLLNTLTNFGGNWPSTLALAIVESLNLRHCPGLSYLSSPLKYWLYCSNSNNSTVNYDDNNILSNRSLHEKIATSYVNKFCQECYTFLDGYYVESILCIFIGFLWLKWKKNKFQSLQNVPLAMWRVTSGKIEK